MRENELIPAKEFCNHHHIGIHFIYSLHQYGLVEIISNEEGEFLSADRLGELEKIIRLHYDLDVNMEGIDVILHLLKQLETSQRELTELRNRLKFYS